MYSGRMSVEERNMWVANAYRPNLCLKFRKGWLLLSYSFAKQRRWSAILDPKNDQDAFNRWQEKLVKFTRSVLRPNSNSLQVPASKLTLSEHVVQCAADIASPYVDFGVSLPYIWTIFERLGRYYRTMAEETLVFRDLETIVPYFRQRPNRVWRLIINVPKNTYMMRVPWQYLLP